MREIKFKAKRIDNGEWVYGYLREIWGENERRFTICPARRFESDGFTDLDEVEVDKETIGQYTGLKDKNGKEIWEFDIVKAPLLDPIFGDIIKDSFCNAEITFNKGSFVVSYYKRDRNIYLSDLCDKIEVIGNIFDNKDLLQ